MNILKRIWNKCTAPSSLIQQRDQRRQAQFLASLLFFMLLFGAVNEFIVDPLLSPDPVNSKLLSSKNITFLVITLAYVFSRTRYYNIGAALVVLFFWIGVFAAIQQAEGPSNVVFAYYLLVPVIFANMFLPLPIAILTAVINCLSLFLVPYLNPSIGYQDLPILFLFFTSGLLMFAVYHRDTLERDRRALLLESEERYRTLLETVFEGIAILQNDQITNVNQGFTKIFGYSPAEAVGHHLAQFIPATPNFQNIKEQSEPIEAKGVTRSGNPLQLELVLKEYMHHEKATWMVAIRDITERKRAAEALQQAQRLDSIGMLAGGIAHDFNNILASVSAQMSLAQMKLPPNNEAGIHLDKAQKSTVVAADLTRQLLAYAGKGSLNVEVFDLNKIVQETASIVEGILPQNVRLHKAYADETLRLHGDRSQIQQVVLNILVNASDAMEEKSGWIRVTTHRQTLPKEISAVMSGGQRTLPAGSYAILSVQDTGTGMTEETRQRIFDPFFSTKNKGHGLGLSAALGLVNTHGGTIFVESKLGQGTTFSIWLPTLEPDVRMDNSNGTHELEGAIAGTNSIS